MPIARRAGWRPRPGRRRRRRTAGSWRGPDGSTVPLAPRPPAQPTASRSGDRTRVGLDRRADPADPHRRLLPGPPARSRRIDLGLWWPTVAIGLGDRAGRRRPAAVAPFRADRPVPYDGAVEALSDPWLTALAGVGVVAGLVLLARGLGRLSVARPGRRHLDLDDRVAGRRRGPGQRHRRTGRADPRLAAPERALRLLPLDGRQRTATADARSGLHGGALDRVPRPRRDGQPARLPARGAVRRAGPLRGRDRHARATSRPGSTSAAAVRRGPAEIDRGGGGGRAADASTTRATRTARPGSATAAAGGRTARRGSSRAIRSRSSAGHSPSPTSPTRPAPTSATAPDAAVDDPEVAADLAEARADGHLADDPAAAWGNAAIPGFGIGRPVVDAGHRPGREPAAARRRRTRRPVPSERSRIAPETLVLAASDEVPLLIAHGVPGRRRRARPGPVHASGCSGRSWRSRRRWSSPSSLSGGFGS